MESLLEKLKKKVLKCQACSLSENRTNVVFGEGKENADIMLVGEAPGENEDKKGTPFCGRSGSLLDKAFEDPQSPLSRSDVRIINTVNCRPPNNRNPKKDEINSCRKIFNLQTKIVDPDVIITLGKVASETVLGKSVKGITKRIGEINKVEIPDGHTRVVVLCPHPSHYLYGAGYDNGVKDISGVLLKASKIVDKMDRKRIINEAKEVF